MHRCLCDKGTATADVLRYDYGVGGGYGLDVPMLRLLLLTSGGWVFTCSLYGGHVALGFSPPWGVVGGVGPWGWGGTLVLIV